MIHGARVRARTFSRWYLLPGCLLAVALAGAEIAGCGEKLDPPPDYSPVGFDGEAVSCAELLDAGPSLAEQGAHVLKSDGGILACFPDGLECPLPDTDAGVCDGGPDAARPYANCLGERWVGHCTPTAH
jgi:hypothetical protein